MSPPTSKTGGWCPRARRPGNGHDATAMTPPEFLSDPALSQLFAALPDARVVGGAVRDALAGYPIADIDLATPSAPSAVTAALTRLGIRVVPTGLDHGTVTAVVAGRGFEITTLRRDVETDGRRAVVAFTDDWREDAARRDFTINAMSMSQDGTLFDYFGGAADLRAGILCFVGDPATRIQEDFLRILRYFRFFARYAARPPSPETRAALRDLVPGLASLPAERVWSELIRILAAPNPAPAIALMDDLGVLAAIIPEGTNRPRLERLIAADGPADPILRAAALLAGDPLAFAARLRLSAADRERLAAVLAAPAPGPDIGDDALRRAMADTDPDILLGRIWLAGDDPAWAALRGRVRSMPRPVFPLAGRDVRALGVAAGPIVGTLLRNVRDWWLAGGCRADKAACQTELARRAAGIAI